MGYLAAKTVPLTALGILLVLALAAGCGTGESDAGSDSGARIDLPSATYSVDVTLSGSDAETCELAFELVSTPVGGTVSEVQNQPCEPGEPNRDSAVVTFTSNSEVCGPSAGSFQYTVSDDLATSAPATVTVDIPCVDADAEGSDGDVN